MRIKVPASSANLGPGFDSMGMALGLYLTIDVLEPTDHWVVDHDLEQIPHDERNMVVRAALKIKSDLAPHHIVVNSPIPLAHGLGSSSSCNVGGIELANQIAKLHLSAEEKVEIASQIEGHPDNVAPTILGGTVIGTSLHDHFIAVKAPAMPYQFVAYVPAYNLKTSDSRNALPNMIGFHEATQASAIANTLVAALFAQDYQAVGELMEADMLHEPYRSKLVPELAQVRVIAHQHQALATYLSGAGPTVMTLLPKDASVDEFVQALKANGLDDPVMVLPIAEAGVEVDN